MWLSYCKTKYIPDLWRKSNLCPFHKKGDKQIINNYRPVSLLIFNSFFEYLEKYKLLPPDKAGFRANDSSVDQLLSIVHTIYTAFDAYLILEFREVFLDMSKAFDKVWHEGLIFKLKSMGISDALLDFIVSFLKSRFPRAVLNGQTSEWLPVKAGVPQGSILGPLFFLIYINDLPIDIISTVKWFSDDAWLFSIIHDATTTAYELYKDLQKIAELAHQWKMSFNLSLNKQAQ